MKTKTVQKKQVIIFLAVTISVIVLALLVIFPLLRKKNRKISLLELQGTVQVERGDRVIKAQKGMKLKSGDVLIVGESSSARLRIDDDKYLFLNSSSRVHIQADGTAENSKTVIYVEKGSVLTEVKRKLSEGSTFLIVTPNTAMSIHGTKTLTEVYEDVLGAIKTSAAIVEGQVVFSAIQKDKTGKAVVVSTDLMVGQGYGVTTESKDLLSEDDVKHISDDGKKVDGSTAEETEIEEMGLVLESPAFSEEFLTNVVAVLARSREEDIEEGFVAGSITEEELNAAINVLNDVIDGKVELPPSVEEYLVSQSQPYYSEPVVVDTGESTGPVQPVANEPVTGDNPTAINGPEEGDNDPCKEGKHELIRYDGKAATCTEKGYEPYETCSRCTYSTYKEIPALNHDLTEHDGKAATCTEKGYEPYVTCSRCNYSTYKEIPALNHDLTEHDGKAATCTEKGYEPYVTCSRCNYSTYKEIPAGGHNFGGWDIAAQPYPVYEEEILITWHTGTKVRTCLNCGIKEEEVILVTPILMCEMFDGSITTLPIDFFLDPYFIESPSENMTLDEFGLPFWVSSPTAPGDPFNREDLDYAEMRWVNGSIPVASLQVGDVIQVSISVPAELRNVYADTVISILLTEAQ